MGSLKDILAVIVIYNINYKDSATINAINAALLFSDQHLDVLIYDNSPSSPEMDPFITYGRLNIKYIHDRTNAGVSNAYNCGAYYAKENDKKWLLLLDQDTTFSEDMFLKYTKAISDEPGIKLFAPILMTSNNVIFSPCKYSFGRGFPLKMIRAGRTSLKNISPVNSGMLIDLITFFKVGMFNPKIKLDFSDFQFIERFKKVESDFLVIDLYGFQDFSNNEVNPKKLNIRYAYFCEGAKNCERQNIMDDIKYFLVAFMRATTLAYRTKSLIYYNTFLRAYLRG